jgi:hypothetical protein
MKTITTRQLLITFVPAIAVLVVAVIMSMVYEINFHVIIREGSILSNLGIILWCVAASVCLFTAITLQKNKSDVGAGFLYCSAFLTAYLLIDDFFQIHEVFIPYLGLDEKIIYVILGIAVITYLIKFRWLILQTNFVFLMLELGFLAASAFSDGIFASLEVVYTVLGVVIAISVYLAIIKQAIFRAYFSIALLIIGLCMAFIIVDSKIDGPEYLLEDGTKWMGIACWCSYYVRTSYQFITGALYSKSQIHEVQLTPEISSQAIQ